MGNRTSIRIPFTTLRRHHPTEDSPRMDRDITEHTATLIGKRPVRHPQMATRGGQLSNTRRLYTLRQSGRFAELIRISIGVSSRTGRHGILERI